MNANAIADLEFECSGIETVECFSAIGQTQICVVIFSIRVIHLSELMKRIELTPSSLSSSIWFIHLMRLACERIMFVSCAAILSGRPS